ncbi:hypothetical protein, partial [Actinocorallia lasiicapitis]
MSRLAALRRKGVSAGGAVAVQCVLAGGSLVLQAVAARSLGAAGYGVYALLYGVLVLVIAVQTSWVGDALTVFDRFEPRVRGALLLSLLITVAGGALVAAVAGAFLLPAATTGLFVLLAVLWVLNETGRRIFTARMEFWRLAANDAAAYAVTLGTLGGAVLAGAEPT